MKRTEHTQKWLDALRSGEYKQGRAYLRDGHDNYCCLGVLADLTHPEAWKQYETSDGKGYCHYAITGTIAGIVVADGGLTRDECGELITFNDTEEYTFPQIADEIEKMLDVG